MDESGFWNRLDLLARSLFPFVASALLIIIGFAPLRAPEIAPALPLFGMAAVYYWCVFRPDLMPHWAIFLLGLFSDLLGGTLVGSSILAFFALYLAISSQRRFFAHASFFLLWLAFALFALPAFLNMWALACWNAGAIITPAPLALQYVLTVAVYPMIAWFFGQSQQVILQSGGRG